MIDFLFTLTDGYPVVSTPYIFVYLGIMILIMIVACMCTSMVVKVSSKFYVPLNTFVTASVLAIFYYFMAAQIKELETCEMFVSNISRYGKEKTVSLKVCDIRERKDGPVVKTRIKGMVK